MTEQEVLDIVVRGLASQEWERSIAYGGHCAYRGAYGRKCAAGWLMNDDEVEENTVISRLKGVCKRLGVDPEFLQSLQDLHDGGPGGSEMLDRFRRFAEVSNLRWPL